MVVPGRIKRILSFACIVLAALLLTACSGDRSKEKEVREQAIGFMEQGDYSAAVARFDEALSYHDGKYGKLEIDILQYRAEAEVMAGDYESAANTFAMLRRNDSDKPEYINMQVICMVRGNGDLSRALELFKTVDEKHPDSLRHKDALYALGLALAESGTEENVREAVALYEKALYDESERTGELYNRMGSITFTRGDIDGALQWFNDGVAFISSKKYAEGEDDESDVLQSLKYNIAICYEYKQEYKKALELFRSYAALYGTNDTIEHEIKFLESRIR